VSYRSRTARRHGGSPAEQLAEELGAPAGEYFKFFGAQPIAAASIAHRAALFSPSADPARSDGDQP
jgi:predicted unusual protein kinase regulating ubiquinone biosynthesis (AarF/ABC1/UbiB family)